MNSVFSWTRRNSFRQSQDTHLKQEERESKAIPNSKNITGDEPLQ